MLSRAGYAKYPWVRMDRFPVLDLRTYKNRTQTNEGQLAGIGAGLGGMTHNFPSRSITAPLSRAHGIPLAETSVTEVPLQLIDNIPRHAQDLWQPRTCSQKGYAGILHP